MTNEIHRHKEKEAHICRNRVFRVFIALMHWDVLSLLLWIKEVLKLNSVPWCRYITRQMSTRKFSNSFHM